MTVAPILAQASIAITAWNHRHIDANAITLLHAQLFQTLANWQTSGVAGHK